MREKLWTICAYGIYACWIALFQKYGIDERVPVVFFLLLCFDSVVGMYKAYILHGDNPNWLSSKKFITGIVTKCMMFSWIGITIIVSHYVFGDGGSVFIKEYLMPMFILVMLVGILHNILQISQKRELPELDLFSMIFKKVQEVLLTSVTKLWEFAIEPEKKNEKPQN